MDNIIDYLVIGFFIISFLASIFKKKKVKAKEHKVVNATSDNAQQKVEARAPKAKSPFDDFFKSINDELAKAKEEVSRSEVDEYYEQALLNSDDSGITEQSSFQEAKAALLIPQVFSQKVDKTKVDKTISIKSYHDSVKFSQSKRESAKSKSIKRRLLQNDSIKDFMIINEILGKPKALQR